MVAVACGRCVEALSCLDGTAVKFRYDSLWTVAIGARGPAARAVRAGTVLEIILREAILDEGLASRVQVVQKYWN